MAFITISSLLLLLFSFSLFPQSSHVLFFSPIFSILLLIPLPTNPSFICSYPLYLFCISFIPASILFPVCSSAPINMKVQHVNSSALVVRWAHPEVTYHPPILHFLVSYSWTAHDDSYEEMHLTDAKHKLVRLRGTGACNGWVNLKQ